MKFSRLFVALALTIGHTCTLAGDVAVTLSVPHMI